MQYKAWLLKIIGLVITIAGMALSAPASVNASVAESWQGNASLASRSERGYLHDGIVCGGIKMTIEVTGNGTFPNACIFGDSEGMRVARFSTGTAYLYAVAFPGAATYYELRGVCANHSCAYAAATDVYITTIGYSSTNYGAVAYRGFSHFLTKHFDIAKAAPYYEFQPSQPDYSVKAGDAWLPVGEMSISSNGVWALVELKDYGILRVDTRTFDTRRFIAPSASYGYGSNPSYEMTISNDGTLAVMAGRNVGFSVVAIDEVCGDRLTSDTQKQYRSTIVHCKSIPLNLSDYTSAVRQIASPWLSATGNYLGLTVVYTDSTSDRLVLTAQDASINNSVAYLALGDSFTSGEGEVDATRYRPLSDTPLTPCHVSWRSYPFLLGKFWDLHTESVACSGARTADIYDSGGYLGQGRQIQQLSTRQYVNLKEIAIDTFRSGVASQSEFILTYQPELVTVGIGGNDAGLIAKLKACLSPGTCEWASDLQMRYATAKEISDVQVNIIQTVQQIRKTSPASKIVLVGYPQIINSQKDAHCGVLLGSLLSREERTFIEESIRHLNEVVKSAAMATSVEYADIESAFQGHELCGELDSLAMNSLRLGDDIAPFDMLPEVYLFGAESFHPTPMGHQLIADTLGAQYPSVDAIEYCVSQCDRLTPAPVPTDYWQPDPTPLYYGRLQNNTNIVTDAIQRGVMASISAPAFTFAPYTTVSIELHSDPVILATAGVGEDGSVRHDIVIPQDTSFGYHTIHIVGSAPDGELLDVYDSVAIIDSSTQNMSGKSGVSGTTNLGTLDRGLVALNAAVANTTNLVDTPSATHTDRQALGWQDTALPSWNKISGRSTPMQANTLLGVVIITTGFVTGSVILTFGIVWWRRRSFTKSRNERTRV